MKSSIENSIWQVWKDCFTDSGEQLFEIVEKWKWKELENLFEWYFSLIENLKWVKNVEEIGNFSYNLDDYNDEFSEILKFSNTPFMEQTAWRESGDGVEYCGAHLRNLLSPFKNLIEVLKMFSVSDNQEKNEKIFNKFIRDSVSSFDMNKKEILKFCEFLDWDTKQD